jgi:hypothetical protein
MKGDKIMRKLMRSMARHNMEKKGYGRLNKKDSIKRSFFSKRWRQYITLKVKEKAA